MTSRILAALLALTGGLLVGALLPLGYAIANQHDRDYRNGTLVLAQTLAAAAEEGLGEDEKSSVFPRTLASLREETEGGYDLAVAVVDDDGRVAVGRETGLYTPGRAAPALAGGTRVTRDGDRMLAVVPVGGSERPEGAVLLSRPLDPLNDRITRLWVRLAMVAVAAIAAAVLLAVALARWVGRPLRRLELAAESLGAGELGARAAPPKRPREVRRLTERFNVMAARLETLIYDSRTVLADVTHQLRTPLAALRLRLELLAQDAGPTGNAAEYDGALGELDRLSRLVDGLLAVARAENTTATPERVAVADLLRERAEAWRPVAAERDVDLSVTAHDQLTALLGPGHLDHVIDNLIDNALTATPPGGHVRLAVRSVDRRVRVTVADDGPGMSPEAMREAFRRFRSGRPRGTGLGLAIVHRLVTANGGSVSLTDTPGGGLTVVVDLPPERNR
ncbi:MAG TPA: HAMP domain-containing sensor histidine kinase [Streptosporangiaceae bacterium]|nr:HAMP domain-containing sensor histidine kinase [Streptosporangiaceae bacterium]